MSGNGHRFGQEGVEAAEAGAERVRRAVEAPLHPQVTVAHVLAEVSTEFDVPVRDLLGPWRRRRLTWPRQAAMALARRHTMNSVSAIARAMGRDHTTVIYGIDAHEAHEVADPAFAARVAAISERLQRRLTHA